MQHRFYGESIPFVSREEALKDANLRGYFSSAQTLADYAEVILHIKKKIFGRLFPGYSFWRIIWRNACCLVSPEIPSRCTGGTGLFCPSSLF
ncbi:hypothetical protein DKX38_016552 [Salix brachista]|uniref:Uncharacterized protein n=1 Tax=Salix brachista TaxID=2182728 RepID=A0A5N5L8A1_9ROSI|nr:hypothetical protein DKX38_016552 [Salix brachista]